MNEIKSIAKATLIRRMSKLYIKRKERGSLKSLLECWRMQMDNELPFTFKPVHFQGVYCIYYDNDDYHEENKKETLPYISTLIELQEFCTNYKKK